jgi:hypothetical protein
MTNYGPPNTITDYYGTRFEVEVVLKSSGPYVYLDRRPEPGFGEETMDRFPPGQARNLAKQLQAAADEAERYGG